MTAEEYYKQLAEHPENDVKVARCYLKADDGNESRRQGKYGEAMSYYKEAISLDPDSPAVTALQMLEDIMNYYCKEMYNP